MSPSGRVPGAPPCDAAGADRSPLRVSLCVARNRPSVHTDSLRGRSSAARPSATLLTDRGHVRVGAGSRARELATPPSETPAVSCAGWHSVTLSVPSLSVWKPNAGTFRHGCARQEEPAGDPGAAAGTSPAPPHAPTARSGGRDGTCLCPGPRHALCVPCCHVSDVHCPLLVRSCTGGGAGSFPSSIPGTVFVHLPATSNVDC